MGDGNETGRATEAESAMMAELARSGSLAERSAWAAKWAARVTAADAAVLFVLDPGQATLVSTGAFGEAASRSLHKTAFRDGGLAAEVLRERGIRVVREDAADPLVAALPSRASTALVAPLLLEKGAAGIVVVGLSRGARARAPHGPRAVPAPRGGVRRSGPRGGGADGRPPGCHRAPDEPLRRHEGVRLDDRTRRALHARRAQGCGFRRRRGRVALVLRLREGRRLSGRHGYQRELRRCKSARLRRGVPRGRRPRGSHDPEEERDRGR